MVKMQKAKAIAAKHCKNKRRISLVNDKRTMTVIL